MDVLGGVLDRSNRADVYLASTLQFEALQTFVVFIRIGKHRNVLNMAVQMLLMIGILIVEVIMLNLAERCN